MWVWTLSLKLWDKEAWADICANSGLAAPSWGQIFSKLNSCYQWVAWVLGGCVTESCCRLAGGIGRLGWAGRVRHGQTDKVTDSQCSPSSCDNW